MRALAGVERARQRLPDVGQVRPDAQRRRWCWRTNAARVARLAARRTQSHGATYAAAEGVGAELAGLPAPAAHGGDASTCRVRPDQPPAERGLPRGWACNRIAVRCRGCFFPAREGSQALPSTLARQRGSRRFCGSCGFSFGGNSDRGAEAFLRRPNALSLQFVVGRPGDPFPGAILVDRLGPASDRA